MTLEQINALSVDELQALMGGSPTLEEIQAYKDQLILKETARIDVKSRLALLSDKRRAFHSLGYDIPNYDLWEKNQLESDPIGMQDIVALMEGAQADNDVEDALLAANKYAKEQAVANFKAKPNNNITIDELKDLVRLLVE